MTSVVFFEKTAERDATSTAFDPSTDLRRAARLAR